MVSVVFLLKADVSNGFGKSTIQGAAAGAMIAVDQGKGVTVCALFMITPEPTSTFEVLCPDRCVFRQAHIPLLPAPAIISPTRQFSTQKPLNTLMLSPFAPSLPEVSSSSGAGK